MRGEAEGGLLNHEGVRFTFSLLFFLFSWKNAPKRLRPVMCVCAYFGSREQKVTKGEKTKKASIEEITDFDNLINANVKQNER